MEHSRRLSVLLIVLVISIAVLSLSCSQAEAARLLQPEDFARANHLSTAYQSAKARMSCWFERLASGPSPRGPGH
ncbi:hypothetical protein SAY87_018369 [Trapa incisa]|uniref:Uncharacterized protein n=2 Tax=Trapa TaxID=22665 RepID=A0AAN7LP33_TRANT|nr:hypothetical protein SAY87_018369 [Trapa incisa]KAK4784810.1 hypothetical protein SAY86_019178 [Trapa natans]